MTPFTAHRITRTTIIRLSAPADQVFPLFSPHGEKLWEPAWDPKMLHPPTGHPETNAVFTTHGHDAAPAVWIIVQFEPTRFQIAYVRVVPSSHVAAIAIHCDDRDAATTAARVTYTFTGLTENGNAYIDTFSEDYYQAWIRRWETAINHYLQHGMVSQPHIGTPGHTQ